jgi:biotin-(acetyl-CoA carboxylase) ligase
MPKLTNEAVTVEPLDADATVEVLNRILHFELDGVMQQFHHRWMSRWLRPARARAITVGQLIASLTGGTTVAIDQLTDDALASSEKLLAAARSHERRRTDEYRRLLELVEGRSEDLEAFARAQIAAAERDVSERASGE